MRSRTNCNIPITSGQVHSWALEWLTKAKLLKDHGWKCTVAIVLGIVLRAAARCLSISAACRDLAKAPSDQAVMTALAEGLPKTLRVLERRLNDALTGPLPRRMRGRAPKKGTPQERTALSSNVNRRLWYTYQRKHNKQPLRIRVGVGYRRHRHRKDGKHRHQKLLFAAWRVYGSPTEIRQRYRLRFGIETSFRQEFIPKSGLAQSEFDLSCPRKPTCIEGSDRGRAFWDRLPMRQGRIDTCTRPARLWLFFLAVALILRNLWVWIHQTHLAEGSDASFRLHLELFQFHRMLDWIAREIVALFHDGSIPYVIRPP